MMFIHWGSEFTYLGVCVPLTMAVVSKVNRTFVQRLLTSAILISTAFRNAALSYSRMTAPLLRTRLNVSSRQTTQHGSLWNRVLYCQRSWLYTSSYESIRSVLPLCLTEAFPTSEFTVYEQRS